MSHSSSNGGAGGPAQHLSEGVCRALLNALLSAEEREALLRHVAACSTCEELLKERVVERESLRASFALRFGPDGEPTCLRLHDRRGKEVAGGDCAPIATAPNGQIEPAAAATRRLRGLAPALLAEVRQRARRGLALPRYRYGLTILGLASVLIVLLWTHDRGPADGSLHWLPISVEGGSVRAVAGTGLSGELAMGLQAYEARDLDNAIELLAGQEAAGLQETIRRIYLGSALALKGRSAEAVSVLRTVRAQTLPDPWGSEARWTLYVVLRECGSQSAADSLLRVLARERGQVGERARRFLPG